MNSSQSASNEAIHAVHTLAKQTRKIIIWLPLPITKTEQKQ